jgi:hypothetical protein
MKYSLPSAMILTLAMGLGAACGSGSSANSDPGANDGGVGSDGGAASPDCSTPGSSAPTPACGNANIVAPGCTTVAPASGVVDISGTWVLQTVGAQVVKASGFVQPFHIKSIVTSLVQVTQTGKAVTFTGQTCNRFQQDDPANPAQVLVLDSWRLTPSPLQRTGTYAPDATGQWTLSMPSLVETFGARLTDPACDLLPLDATDPRLVDDDNDGAPGISVGLKGLVTGSLRAVQRQVTALTGVAVSADRIQGGMSYASDQTVVASNPSSIECLYRLSQAYTDPAECSSTFTMVKVGAGDCAWVRDNQAALGL